MSWWRRLWRRLVARWRSPVPAPVLLLAAPRVRGRAASLVLPDVICLPGPPRVKRGKPQHPRRQLTQEMLRFREHILDKLDNHMRIFRRVKTIAPETYEVYSRIGTRITPLWFKQRSDDAPLVAREIEPWFRNTLPSMGCVAYAIHSDDIEWEHKHNSYSPRFLHFHKFERPPAMVQLSNNPVYVCHAYFDVDRPNSGRGEAGFAVEINPQGMVMPLRLMLDDKQVVRHKKYGDSSVIHHQRWGIPEMLRDWAEQNHTKTDEFLRYLFADAANLWLKSHAEMVHITATGRAGITAAFSVPIEHCPSFFKDRETVLTPSGRSAPCFHVVRTHQRTSVKGRQYSVPIHFAGVRHFRWHDYDVHITVPGYHHHDLADMQFGAIDAERLTPDQQAGLISDPEMAILLERHVREGWKTRQRLRQ